MREDIEALLERADTWARIAGIQLSTLSNYMTNRGSRLREIKEGKYVPRASAVQRWFDWMDQNPALTWRERNPRGAAGWRNRKKIRG